MINLYIMSGIPGSGKSTWLYNCIEDSSIVISRDEIRFSMLNTGDDYFKYEKEVFNEYVKQIQEAIDSNDYQNIYCDATQITEKSRNKLLDRLNLDNVNIMVIYLDTSLKVALKRNKLRSGLEYVPDDTIKEIYKYSKKPTFDEKYKYKEIITINGNLLNF